MSISWFIYSNDLVTGPFTTDDVSFRLESGILSPQSFIWWKGQREWIQLSVWAQQLPAILDASTQRGPQSPIWYIEISGSRLGPITHSELVQHLRSLPNLSVVRLWAIGMPAWSNIFDLPEVMETVGISRRETERAPLMGSVAVSRSNDDPQNYNLRAASISIGGMGMTGHHDLRRGDTVSLVVKSQELGEVIHVPGEVIYVTSNNYVGVKFTAMPAEAASFVIDYVKKFTDFENALEEKSAA